ncbi:TonB-dependent receptor [Maricaulis sp. CAU 1757]
MQKLSVVLGLAWLLIGMTLGQVMGASGDHSQMPTHAHIMLVGGALSIFWGILFRLFAPEAGLLGWIQLILHQAGTVVLVGFLYMLYGGQMPEAEAGPILGIAGFGIMLAAALMLWVVARSRTS